MPATLRIGLDHYIVANEGNESVAVYGEPCVLLEESSGDLLYAHLDIPAEDGSVRGANGLEVTTYRLSPPTPDQIEETTLDDVGPDGFDFEQEDDYESPFAGDDEYTDEIDVDTDADEDEDEDAK